VVAALEYMVCMFFAVPSIAASRHGSAKPLVERVVLRLLARRVSLQR
jgi:hypothetical protein